MGAFYGSMLITGAAAPLAGDFLKRVKRTAYVLTLSASQVIVWDKEVQGFDGVDDLHRVASVLSVPEQTTIVGALNFDDDVLGLSLYVGGEEIDFYLSRPEMLDEPAESMGDADVWCDTLSLPWLKPKVRALFAAEDVTFEHARHTAIAEAFGWPSWVVGVSYDTIASGDTPDDFPRDQLVHVAPA
ncbi:hypothetical protein [Gemmatimonas sp.]|uniref:hypothetical protein n=1 Tax=Gemmatimonas sp. TaxID=1962908 RepID=UPI003DA3B0A2